MNLKLVLMKKNLVIIPLALFAILSGGGGIAIIVSKFFSLSPSVKLLTAIVTQTDYLSALAFVIMGVFAGCLARVIKRRVLL